MADTDRKDRDFHHVFDSLDWLFHVSLERLIGFAIVTYFSGWQYLDAYFSRFNANEWNAWFNDYTIFLYSFFVLADLKGSWVWIINFVFFMVVVGFLSTIRISDRYSMTGTFIRRFLIAIGVFWFLYHVSHDAGIRKAEALLASDEERRVEVYLSKQFYGELKKTLDEETANVFLADLIKQSREGTLRLIWRTDDDTIVLLAGHDRPTTYRIPNKFIVYIDAKLSEQGGRGMEQSAEGKGKGKEGK